MNEQELDAQRRVDQEVIAIPYVEQVELVNKELKAIFDGLDAPPLSRVVLGKIHFIQSTLFNMCAEYRRVAIERQTEVRALRKSLSDLVSWERQYENDVSGLGVQLNDPIKHAVDNAVRVLAEFKHNP